MVLQSSYNDIILNGSHMNGHSHNETEKDANCHGQVNSNGVHCKEVSRRVSVVGACVNEGQNWYTGVETAPHAFREAGLVRMLHSLGIHVNDTGDIHPDYNMDPETLNEVEKDLEYYSPSEIPRVDLVGSACRQLHEVVKRESDNGNFVLTIGGDHSIAVGTISGIIDSKKDVGVVWIDAHADCNTPETSPSRNFHGMPVGMLLGWFKKRVPGFEFLNSYLKNNILPENRVAYIGLRDVDEGEKELLRNSKVLVYSMIEVERLGISRVMEDIIEKLSPPENPRAIHLSMDIDGMDPAIAPGTGTRSKGGISYREARYICTRLAESGRLESMDLVEVNPTLDTPPPTAVTAQKEHGDDPSINANSSTTVKLGLDLISFALGKTLV